MANTMSERADAPEKTVPPLSAADEQRLQQVVTAMRREPYWQPGNSKRLSKAERLYREGAVVPLEQGLFQVQASDEAESYLVKQTCPCAYAQERNDRFCSHRIAVALYRQMHAGALAERAHEDAERQARLEALGQSDSHHDMPKNGLADENTPIDSNTSHSTSLTTEAIVEPARGQKMPSTLHHTVAPLPASLTCRSITAIIADLSRPLPEACVATKVVKGTTIRYLHWQAVMRILDTYAPGCNGEVTRLEQHGSTLRVTYRLYIPCAEGVVWREATGEDDEWDDEDTEEKRYGNPSANAQANAFKRAAALFGVGMWLYDKPNDSTAKGLAEYFKNEKQAALIDLGKALIDKGMSRKQAADWLKTKAGVTSIDQIPIAAIKTMLAYVIETPEVHDDLHGYPEGWLTEMPR